MSQNTVLHKLQGVRSKLGKMGSVPEAMFPLQSKAQHRNLCFSPLQWILDLAKIVRLRFPKITPGTLYIQGGQLGAHRFVVLNGGVP